LHLHQNQYALTRERERERERERSRYALNSSCSNEFIFNSFGIISHQQPQSLNRYKTTIFINMFWLKDTDEHLVLKKPEYQTFWVTWFYFPSTKHLPQFMQHTKWKFPRGKEVRKTVQAFCCKYEPNFS